MNPRPLIATLFAALNLFSSVMAADRPNIILFLIDDQDRASIGAFGGETYTPNLDRMAAGEAWIDDALGSVLNKLKELGIDDNTLVLFAPDHGRRGKSSLYTSDGVGIPMIARWPGNIPANSTCDEMVINVDWVPTAFDIAGVEKPEAYRMDGRSIRSLLEAEPNAKGRDHVYIEERASAFGETPGRPRGKERGNEIAGLRKQRNGCRKLAAEN